MRTGMETLSCEIRVQLGQGFLQVVVWQSDLRFRSQSGNWLQTPYGPELLTSVACVAWIKLQ